jgi:hypothetical protein
VIRIATVLLALVGGLGLIAYMAAWIIVPLANEPTSIAKRLLADRRELGVVGAAVTASIVLLLGLEASGVRGVGTFVWPLVIGTDGLFIVWRGASPEERAHLRELLESTPGIGEHGPQHRSVTVIRCAVGLLLVFGGLGSLAAIANPTGAATYALLGALGVLGGFFLIFGPWWLRVLRQVTDERRERVRAEERADMAAHIHDSVLQTLTLIQKAARDPGEVTRLARSQERDLRSWLFDGKPPGALSSDPATLGSALNAIERDLEEGHDVIVETIVVGDRPLDDRLRALLAAGREAMVNAAKWSGAPIVSVYVEVEPNAVSMFVKDRGAGFDIDAVPSDRQGIASSIRERMVRQGGEAKIRSVRGEGTEVELVMPHRNGSR